MDWTVRQTLAAAALLFLLSQATCHYGQQYALVDYYGTAQDEFFVGCYNSGAVGDGWVFLAALILALAAAFAVAGVRTWAREQDERAAFCHLSLTTLNLNAVAPTRTTAPAKMTTPPPAAAPARAPRTPAPRGFSHYDERGRTPLERVLDEK